MHHNYQIALNGRCNCKCHQGYDVCTCLLPEEERKLLNYGVRKPTRKPRTLNVESRVKAFSKRRGEQTISYTKEHGFHAPGIK